MFDGTLRGCSELPNTKNGRNNEGTPYPVVFFPEGTVGNIFATPKEHPAKNEPPTIYTYRYMGVFFRGSWLEVNHG